MAFYKVCTCGEKIVFERILSFPDNCPSCGRKLVNFSTNNEDDPCVEELMKGNVVVESSEIVGKDVSAEPGSFKKKYILELNNGKK